MPALAHRLVAAARALGAAAAAARTSCVELLDRVPTPAPSRRPSPRLSDPRGDAEARRLRRARRRSGCSPRSSSAGRSRPRSRRPFAARCSSSALSLAERAEAERRSSSSTPSAQVEGEPVEALLELRAERHGRRGWSCCSTCRAGLVDRGAEPAAAAALRRRAAGARATRSAASAGAPTSSATSSCARRTASACSSTSRSSSCRRPLKVYPRGEELARLLRPLETQVVRRQPGRRASAARGSSSPTCGRSCPGDRVRRVNWRATARRGEPWVNETHPERNADVVIFLDTFAEARAGGERHARPRRRAPPARSPRTTSSEKDRVGLVAFGGVLNWLTASSGIVQLYRVARLAARHRDLPQLRLEGHRRAPGAHAAAAARSCSRSRRCSTTARCARCSTCAPAASTWRWSRSRRCRSSSRDASELDELAYRLWLLRREALRGRATCGSACRSSSGGEGEPLQAALEEVRTFRRHARVVRV